MDFRTLKVTLAAGVAALAISGCGSTQYSDIHWHKGKFFHKDQPSLFTGHVTNIPVNKIIGETHPFETIKDPNPVRNILNSASTAVTRTIGINDETVALFKQHTSLPRMCNADIVEGEINGNLECFYEDSGATFFNTKIDGMATSGTVEILYDNGDPFITMTMLNGRPVGTIYVYKPNSLATIQGEVVLQEPEPNGYHTIYLNGKKHTYRRIVGTHVIFESHFDDEGNELMDRNNAVITGSYIEWQEDMRLNEHEQRIYDTAVAEFGLVRAMGPTEKEIHAEAVRISFHQECVGKFTEALIAYGNLTYTQLRNNEYPELLSCAQFEVDFDRVMADASPEAARFIEAMPPVD